MKNLVHTGNVVKGNPKFFYLVLGVIFSLSITGCIFQKDIDLAYQQTLSASSPVSIYSNSTDNQQIGGIVGTAVPSFTIPKTGNSQLTFTPKLTKLLSPENYIFKADFETGDFSSFTGSDAEYFGKGEFYEHKIVTGPALGNYSAALTIGSGDSTAAYLFTYKVPTTALGYYSVDYYIPSNVIPDDWWNVWQWKSRDESYNKPIITLNLLQKNGVLLVNMFYTPGGINTNPTQQIIQENPIAFPIDQWVNITGYYLAKSDDSGYVVIYQNGVKIFEKSEIQTKPGDADIFWSVNSYADKISPNPATIYVDNLNISEME